MRKNIENGDDAVSKTSVNPGVSKLLDRLLVVNASNTTASVKFVVSEGTAIYVTFRVGPASCASKKGSCTEVRNVIKSSAGEARVSAITAMLSRNAYIGCNSTGYIDEVENSTLKGTLFLGNRILPDGSLSAGIREGFFSVPLELTDWSEIAPSGKVEEIAEVLKRIFGVILVGAEDQPIYICGNTVRRSELVEAEFTLTSIGGRK